MKRLLLYAIVLVIAASPVTAETRRENLDALNQKLAEESRQKESLERQAQEIGRELSDTKGKLVKIGASIQDNEKSLGIVERRVDELEEKEKTLSASLYQERKTIAELVLALERLRRVPPEVLIARPGAPLQTAQSAMLMKDIIPALYHKAELLRASLAELKVVSAELSEKKAKALVESKKLKKQRSELSVFADRREKLYASTEADLAERQENIKRISMQARNLGDLVAKLDKEERRWRHRPKSSHTASLPKPGSARLPVAGYVSVRYGEPDAFGAASKGLTIEAVDGALVVAPMGGVVRFAGTFMNYGQLVIVEHEKGFHSLIAGLKKIDTVVGQSVAPGEPLGLLGSPSNGNKPTLYYELRLNGQPVNPSQKFNDLG